jgi:hypothetical protein
MTKARAMACSMPLEAPVVTTRRSQFAVTSRASSRWQKPSR